MTRHIWIVKKYAKKMSDAVFHKPSEYCGAVLARTYEAPPARARPSSNMASVLVLNS